MAVVDAGFGKGTRPRSIGKPAETPRDIIVSRLGCATAGSLSGRPIAGAVTFRVVAEKDFGEESGEDVVKDSFLIGEVESTGPRPTASLFLPNIGISFGWGKSIQANRKDLPKIKAFLFAHVNHRMKLRLCVSKRCTINAVATKGDSRLRTGIVNRNATTTPAKNTRNR